MLLERFPTLTPEEIMVIAGIPTQELLHTRAAQDLIEKGPQEGREVGRREGEASGRSTEAAAVALHQLNRRCGPLSEAAITRIQALPLEQLEALTDAILDFNGPGDLTAWLVFTPAER